MNPALTPIWAFDQLGIGRWCRDLRTGELTWDDRMREVTGIAEPLRLERWVDSLAHPDDRDQMRELVARAQANESFDTPSIRILLPDGEVRWLRLCGRCDDHADDASGEELYYRGVALDVTDEVLVQRRLAEAERLETLGRFSAGVSHNFNNMLMVVSACLDLLGRGGEASTQPRIAEVLEDAREATWRAADMVAQVAQISRLETSLTRGKVHVAEVCETLVRLVRHALPDEITLDVSIESDAVVEVVPGSLEQVLQNLVNNARDALVAARTRNPKITLCVRTNESVGDPWVELLVTDNGPGVLPEVEDQLFEPFVTTKGRDGMGLGLASSSAIIQRHGGHLAYRPSPSGGAEFLVSLPVARASGERLSEESASIPATSRRLRVLVVDDEHAILRGVSEALGSHGFEVEVAEGRASVEAHLEERVGDVDVVLLDRTLGLERGGDLVELLRERLPGARILYFTGETLPDEEVARVDGVVHKPIKIDALIRAISAPS